MQRGEFNASGALDWYHARRPSAVIRQLRAEKTTAASLIQAAARRRQLQAVLVLQKADAPR
jgi:hypothetical protein